MKRVRFAPSPTGSLHVGNALSAVANRAFGDWLLLRIDDTDPARNVAGGEEELLRDLEWLGLEWEEGPVRQSDRRERHLEAAAQLGERFDGTTLVREDGTPTYHLASVVDDVDFRITHIIRGNDHRPNEALHRRLFEALGAAPRIRRLAIEAIGAMSDDELAERAGAPAGLVPALRGARDLNEARDYARSILEPEPVELPEASRPTLERFAELLSANAEAHALIRELKAVGGDLKTVRLALTGRERGPELWAVVQALSRDKALRRAQRSLPQR